MGVLLLGRPVSYTVPDLASAVGYNVRTFVDDFNSLSTIDLNNTGAPGFKWYTQDHFALTDTPDVQSQLPQPADTLSVANSELTISNVGQGGNNFSISTAYLTGVNSGTNTWRGQLFKNGFFVKFSDCAFDESLAPDTSAHGLLNARWPAWWLASYSGAAYGSRWIEPDLLDALPGGAGAVGFNHYLHDWHPVHGDANAYTDPIDRSELGLPSGGGIRMTDKFSLSMLWVKPNGATPGYYKFYCNDVLLTTVPYNTDNSQTAHANNPFTGAFSDADNHGDGFCLIMSSGCRGYYPEGETRPADWPIRTGKVEVFQTSAADTVIQT